MNARTAVTTMVFAFSLMTTSPLSAEAGFAAEPVPPSGSAPNVPVLLPTVAARTKPGKVRQIGFTLQNGTAAVLRLQAGTDEILLQPGETRRVKLAEGTTLTTMAATPRFPAGAMLTTVSSALRGSILTVS